MNISPEDWHSLINAVVNLLYIVGGFIAHGYAAKQGAATATTAATAATIAATSEATSVKAP